MYAVLAAVGDYPTWWPQVRSVDQVAEDAAAVVVRSVLPYTLRLVLTRETEDPRHGVLRVRVTGDLDGYAQWVVSSTTRRAGAAAEFTEEVEVTGALGRVARPAAALLRANHLAMMRAGERGLERLLGETG